MGEGPQNLGGRDLRGGHPKSGEKRENMGRWAERKKPKFGGRGVKLLKIGGEKGARKYFGVPSPHPPTSPS